MIIDCRSDHRSNTDASWSIGSSTPLDGDGIMMTEKGRIRDWEVAVNKGLKGGKRRLTTRGNPKVIHHLGKGCGDSQLTMCAKKPRTTTTRATSTGDVQAVISRPVPLPAITCTGYPCEPANPTGKSFN